jgi:hypothetical protein
LEAPCCASSPIVSNHLSFICSYWFGICYQVSLKLSPPGKGKSRPMGGRWMLDLVYSGSNSSRYGLFFFFGSTGVCTQDLALAMLPLVPCSQHYFFLSSSSSSFFFFFFFWWYWVLYHLSHSISPALFGLCLPHS